MASRWSTLRRPRSPRPARRLAHRHAVPAALARYIARSAASISASASSPCSGHETTPIDSPTGGSAGIETSSATAVASRSPSARGGRDSCSGASTQNSSPPRRAATSTVRIDRLQRHRDLHQQPVARLVALRVVDPLEPVDVHQQHPERVPVALLHLEHLRQLGLQVAQVAEPGERIGVRLRLELARARPHQLLDRGGLHRAGRVGQPLDRVGEALRVLLGQLVAQGAHQHGLERGDVARDLGGARVAPAAQPRQGRGALALASRSGRRGRRWCSRPAPRCR